MPETRIGEYLIQVGNANADYWPLRPGLTVVELLVDSFFNVAPSDPSTANTLTLARRFGVFDIVIRMSEPVVETALTDNQSVNLLQDSLGGQAQNTAMPMWSDGSGTTDNRVARICFAVAIPDGQEHFEGTLVLTSENAGTTNAQTKTVRVPIRVGVSETVSDLLVFFIATPRNKQPREERYCWSKIQMVDWADSGPYSPLQGANVIAKVLRDNFRRGFKDRNRQITLQTDADGYAAYPSDQVRNIIALPINWPLIFTANIGGHVDRVHLTRLAAANIDHNQAPHNAGEIKAIADGVAGARMPSRKVLADPGHGVVYGFTGARRSQEWFVAHRVARRVGEILRTRFSFPAANFFMTRTAGFGLINPADMNLNNAPELGAQRFVFDISDRKVRIRQNALGLVDLSNLVLTGNNDNPATITEADRNRLISTNTTTMTTVLDRIQRRLPAGQRVQPGSARWHVASSNYVCRIERHPPVAGQPPIVDDARHISIGTNDWFTLDAAMLNLLARRTARWSIERELGSGPAADATTGRPGFTEAARTAMNGANAEDYMVQQIIAELDLEAPYAAGATVPSQYRNKESMGWHYRVRRDYINRKNCDINLSIHENAGALNSAGMVMLVGNSPPQDHMRAAKLFMKYADPFDQGLRQGGIATSGAGQLSSQNQRREKHVYFELEFMSSLILDNPGVRTADASRYQYQLMVENRFVEDAAQQIVAGVVEFLIDPQSDINTVEYDLSTLPTW